jgi:hypothetical protein
MRNATRQPHPEGAGAVQANLPKADVIPELIASPCAEMPASMRPAARIMRLVVADGWGWIESPRG